MKSPPTVVGIGELLWDQLPSGRQLGGAPANFAYCSHLLGNRAVVASRVGRDRLGGDLRQALIAREMTDQFLETDSTYPTGTVQVELSGSGQPKFVITYPAAWDFFEWSEQWRGLAESADALCFGSLAQRSVESRSTIQKFLDSAPQGAFRIFDVNLRQTFYSPDVIISSLTHADALKLSHEELPTLGRLLGLRSLEPCLFCRELFERFPLQLVSITRGENGSLLIDPRGINEHRGFSVRVRDAVGAGDAFTAGLVDEFLRGGSLAAMNDLANRMGAWVASCSGAMPPVPSDGLRNTLARLQMKS
ncbi:MAG: carbohydrate kinase [Acidobacteria bacterium]|nr:carbohydrate kinase [Acidobacteriota bacterium]